MKHRIRKPNGEIIEIEGALGSGILDKNGNEIFEGDKIYTNYTKKGTVYHVDKGWIVDYWYRELRDIPTGLITLLNN